MTQKLPLCFEVYLKRDTHSPPRLHSSTLAYGVLLNSLTQVCENFTFSLRHLYDPLDNQKLRSFILINPSSQVDDRETFEKIEGLLKGILSRFYSFTYQSEVVQELNWVTSIGQLLKHGEFVDQPEFIGYLPHPFSTELNDENPNLLELLQQIGCQKLVLEFSLGAYLPISEKACWSNAVEDLVSRLSNCASKSNSIKNALELYRNYQDNYSESQLFRYSIKALGCNSRDTIVVLEALGGIVCKKDTRQKSHSIITFKPHDSSFANSLEATQTIKTFQGITWDGWERSIGKKIEYQPVKRTVKPDGLLAMWDDGSLDPPKPFLTFEESLELFKDKNLALPQTNKSNGESETSSAIEKVYEDRILKVEHLKPLHHITTFQEVIGFFQVFSPSVSFQQHNLMAVSAEEIFIKYWHLINEDTYIVGLDDNGNPITSSWAEIPHRLVAGQTGFGKTNFIQWIMFQFFYKNPKAKVYIMDFKGIDFPDIKSILPELRLDVVTEVEDATEMIEAIDREEKERANLINQYPGVKTLTDLRKKGIDVQRLLWIIDEAADIADAPYNLSEEVEKRLKKYARKGRSFGIHMIYAAQRPDVEVISKQVTDQLGEKTVFKVTASASMNVLEIDCAENIDQKGRAILHRGVSSWLYVNTPVMPDLSSVSVSDSIWNNIHYSH